MTKKTIDRRDFLVGSASLALATGLGACAHDAVALDAAVHDAAAHDAKGIGDSSLTDVVPPPAGAVDNLRVVHATDKAMIKKTPTIWTYQTQNDAVDSAQVSTNLDKMALALAGATDVATAWKTIFSKPTSKAWSDVKLAIKVNTVESACIPRHAVVVKICEVAIKQLGIKGSNICVYDVDFTAHSGHHPGIVKTYAANTTAYPFPTGVKLSANCFSGQKSTVAVPGGTLSSVNCLKDLVDGTVDILVNIAVNKGHYLAGNVTLTQKNHIGSLKFFCPGKTVAQGQGQYVTGSAQDLVALNRSAAIVGGDPVRQQLCIVDSLWAMRQGPAGGAITHEPATLVMGRFGGAVDYLTEKKIRDELMKYPSSRQDDINHFITGYGYTNAQRLALTQKTPAQNNGRGWVNALA
jgi:hypothetical protein